MALKKNEKLIWTKNIDDAVNYPYEQRIAKYRGFIVEWCEAFGEDCETELNKFQDRIDDRLTLGIIDKCYSMGVIDYFRYLESLKRLAMSGQIIRKKNGWRIKA